MYNSTSLTACSIRSAVADIQCTHAIYYHRRKQAVSFIKNFLEKNDIHVCVRYAQWEYQNMEQNILAGKAVAEKLNGEARHTGCGGRLFRIILSDEGEKRL